MLDGRAAISCPAQFFRTPQCKGAEQWKNGRRWISNRGSPKIETHVRNSTWSNMGTLIHLVVAWWFVPSGLMNLADSDVASRFAKMLHDFDVLVLHSCSHDLCNQNYAKPRLRWLSEIDQVAWSVTKVTCFRVRGPFCETNRILEQYGQNLQRLSKILRAHAAGKRIIWLSCAAQSGLQSTWKFTQTQARSLWTANAGVLWRVQLWNFQHLANFPYHWSQFGHFWQFSHWALSARFNSQWCVTRCSNGVWIA